MNNPPYDFDYINAANAAINPSTMHARNTGLVRFFERYLLQKAISRVTLEIPEEWPTNYVKYVLFIRGFFAVIETDRFGVIPQQCTLAGWNLYRQPTRALVANPVFDRTYELRIGLNTEIVKLAPDYGGIFDLVSYYADLMALASESMGVNILNSKLAYVFAAKNKATAETFKKLFDRIASGEPAAVVDKDLMDDDGRILWEYFSQDLAKNFIAPQLMILLRQIEAEYDTRIGIPNANTDKRERLNVDEVNANNVETYSLLDQWVQTINEDMRKVNEMFGLDLSARINTTAEEVSDNEQSDIIGFRPL